LVGDLHDFPIHGWRSRGYLPHLDFRGTVQHVVFSLADSLPALTDGETSPSMQAIEAELDRGLGECLLRDVRCAKIVQDELFRLDGERYRLLAWCVMPNHVHVVIEQVKDLAGTVRRWKSWTAREINSTLDRSGSIWRREYFDRFARNERHLQTMIHYVEANPVKAGLVAQPVDWVWSSAAAARRGWTP
jgi:REP element-mobilizing transposase RayT